MKKLIIIVCLYFFSTCLFAQSKFSQGQWTSNFSDSFVFSERGEIVAEVWLVKYGGIVKENSNIEKGNYYESDYEVFIDAKKPCRIQVSFLQNKSNSANSKTFKETNDVFGGEYNQDFVCYPGRISRYHISKRVNTYSNGKYLEVYTIPYKWGAWLLP